MSTRQIHDFGRVDEKGDAFEFVIEPPDTGACVFVAVVQTERGPRRTEIARVPAAIWGSVAAAAVKELTSEMGDDEREKKPPSLRAGLNRLSPLVGRELGVLLIALMEEGASDRIDALLHAWRELAREERWWLYAKAAAPGQQRGTGWRRALFHALSETSETRVAPTAEAQKKKLWEHQPEEVTEAPAAGYGTQPASDPAGSASAEKPPVQGPTKGRRRKAKGKQEPAADDPQIDLF